MPEYPINHHLYTYFWNKYRPAIVKLMMDAANGPQEYKFQQHEFKDINPKEKGGYTFKMEAFQGKAHNNIKKWVVAQDLLLTIQKSAKALELLEAAIYTFELDKQYVLHVSCEPFVVETEETEEAAPAVEQEEETPAAETVEQQPEAAEVEEEVAEEEKKEE